ncbi:MAG TPA: site-specific recombinase [Thauera sp.]|uniref:site-specific recombinase n=1 Tax=Thauera sp. TaxID=1905334 RepID=UPI002C693624|nr:site-specific recombinase [Thauera sp.]HRP26064.1 site-specific recombinase [Thauera sp.]HRP66966.1 site-specific recombinase [Thauera sp.]
MERLLERFGQPEQDQVALWVALVDKLRPPRATQTDKATENLRALATLLARRSDLLANLRAATLRVFAERKQVTMYVASGLLPSTGFFSETSRRIGNRLLPEVIDTAHLRDLLSAVFNRVDDEVWVNAISDEDWQAFLHLLVGHQTPMFEEDASPLPHAVREVLESLRVLSFHVSAIGLDRELVRIDPNLEEHESPFLAQNAELLTYIQHYSNWWTTPGALIADDKHLTVMLHQCDEILQRVRKRATRIGTSLTLTFKLERLRQHLERINELTALLSELRTRRVVEDAAPRIVRLFKTLVRAECRKNVLADYWGKNVELLSLRMTESASKTGEKYITSSRGEYFGMLSSAALGGLIIAFMAANKIVLGEQGMAPLNELLSFCLNYGLGFALIHMLGGTVATKQPAMTANAIAASIGEAKSKGGRDLEDLADLIVRTIRSQAAAILGNIGVAIPVALGVGLIIQLATGSHFVTPQKAEKLLGEIDPLSGAPFFAAIAGVCLFMSGLIAAFYDNLSAYNRVPQRLRQLRWPKRLLGEARAERLVIYIENNLGAIVGNIFFGFLLGGATAIGVLFGLPVDIRHIAFSSAYLGYASVALDFAIPLTTVLVAFSGVLLIGIVNLLVSFTLTLSVAMRARRISFEQGRSLGSLLAKRLLRAPRAFLFPPRNNEPTLGPTPPNG